MVDNTLGGRSVLVAGATGYLGSRVVRVLAERGAHVRALVRPGKSAPGAAELFEAEATRAETLRDCCDGIEWVFSALGVTRQRDGVGFEDVDFGANLSLLREAERSGVTRFGVISVVGAERFRANPMVAAKLRFLEALGASEVSGRVVAATGFFSDMGEIFGMARRGRVFLFGDGAARINPVDGLDVAAAVADALGGEEPYMEVGGPDVLTWNEIAALAFEALGKPTRTLQVPPAVLRALLPVARLFASNDAAGLDFFLRVSTSDVVGPTRGTHTLAAHFAALASDDAP